MGLIRLAQTGVACLEKGFCVANKVLSVADKVLSVAQKVFRMAETAFLLPAMGASVAKKSSRKLWTGFSVTEPVFVAMKATVFNPPESTTKTETVHCGAESTATASSRHELPAMNAVSTNP